MLCDRCNFCFSFWGIFSPFTALTTRKIKILKRDIVCNKWTDRQTDKKSDI